MTPCVTFPTTDVDLGCDGVEGSIAVPMAPWLPGDCYLGVTTRLDAVRDHYARGYHPEFGNAIAFGHDLFGPVFGYVEFFSSVSTKPGVDWVGTVEPGPVWGLTENVQLTAGLSVGVTAGRTT